MTRIHGKRAGADGTVEGDPGGRRAPGVLRLVLANMAAAAATLTAGTVVVVTSVLVRDLDPETLAFLRFQIAVVVMLPALPMVWPKVSISTPDIARIAVLGILFFGYFPWAFTTALQSTTAARGAIGISTLPIQTLVLTVLLRKDRMTGARLASACLALVGIVIVFGGEALGEGVKAVIKGDLLMLSGVFGAAIYMVFARPYINRYGAMFVTIVAMAAGVAALMLVMIAGHSDAFPLALTREQWWAMAYLGVVGGAVQFALFIWALGVLPPLRTAIYLTLSPISAVLLAVVLVGENIGIRFVVGLCLVLAAILTSASRPATDAPRGANMETGT